MGKALESFKVVSFYNSLYYITDGISITNLPVIKQYIESELRKQLSLNNSKQKLSCFVTTKYRGPSSNESAI